MKRLIKKCLSILLVFFAVTLCTFLLISLAPSDAAEIMLSKTGVPASPEVLEKTREEMGLNRPVLVQYGSWLSDVLRGNMGTSYRSSHPVAEELLKAFPFTLKLTLLAMAMVILISFLLGIISARYQNRLPDKIIGFFSYLFVAMPSFVLGLMLMYILCVKLHWFRVTPEPGIKGYVMPAVVMALSLSAWYTRQIRTIVLREWHQDYVTGARARGVSERRILYSHILKNSMIPILTLLGNTFAMLLGGTTIVENIFSIPGAGYLIIESIGYRDYPVLQAYVLCMAVIFLIVNGLIDVSYSWIDPRVRKAGKNHG